MIPLAWIGPSIQQVPDGPPANCLRLISPLSFTWWRPLLLFRTVLLVWNPVSYFVSFFSFLSKTPIFPHIISMLKDTFLTLFPDWAEQSQTRLFSVCSQARPPGQQERWTLFMASHSAYCKGREPDCEFVNTTTIIIINNGKYKVI